MKIKLTRIENNMTFGTFGVLAIDGKAFCVTLEPPDRQNKPKISCIPTGIYTCKKVKSPKFGDTWEITNVPGRGNILFHAGNYVGDTLGCVLLASHFSKINQPNRAVLNSGATFKEFLNLVNKEKLLELTIVSSF